MKRGVMTIQKDSLRGDLAILFAMPITLCVMFWLTGLYRPYFPWHTAQAWNALWLAFAFWLVMEYLESEDGTKVSWYPAAGFMTVWFMRMFYIEIGFPYVWIPWSIIIVFLLVAVVKELKINLNFLYDMAGVRR